MNALMGLWFFSNLLFRITEQPASKEMVEGDTYTLRIRANRICKFQWYKDDRLIPGATNNTLVIPYALDGDIGSYHVVASKGSKVIQSSKAIINVNRLVRVLADGIETNGVVVMTKPMTVRIISYEKSARVHYTLDGSEPTEKSRVYTGPFPVGRSAYLRMYVDGLETDSVRFRLISDNVYQN